jgi:glycosyltransferase involved in cell wall biosynthesis
LKVVLLNQCFYPDVVATAQQAADLARELAGQGHQVTVIASRRAYDDPSRHFSASEVWEGIRIERIATAGFGKASKWGRAANFASFMLACVVRLLRLGRVDSVVALTSPPLIGTVAAAYCRLTGSRLLLWMMDLNPDEAIAAGWLREGSLPARSLAACLNFSLRAASGVVALDGYMRDRIVSKGVPPERVEVIPPWPHAAEVRFDAAGRERFRAERGWQNKFVVMYAGNHSPCHPLDTVVEAAARLREVTFLFQGGGSQFGKIRERARSLGLDNVVCEPYRPLNELAASLSAADLHVVSMGDPFVGIVHPSKVYNIRLLGKPFLYVGPECSPVADLGPAASVRHGDVDGAVRAIQRIAAGGLTAGAAYGEEHQRRRVSQLAALIAAVGERQHGYIETAAVVAGRERS